MFVCVLLLELIMNVYILRRTKNKIGKKDYNLLMELYLKTVTSRNI